MLVNKIVPVEMKDRICVHCENGTTYLIAEPKQGKTTETIRQAVFRGATILSTESEYYRSCGIKHATEAAPGEISCLGIKDIVINDFSTNQGELHLCVDNGKKILEELLSMRFNTEVKIDFMSLEA